MDATVFSAFDDGVVDVLEQLAPTAEISPGLNTSAELGAERHSPSRPASASSSCRPSTKASTC